MNKNVFLLYEGDVYLSTDSLVLMGIFTSEKNLRKAVKKLIKERISENFDPTEYSYPTTKTQFIKEQILDFMELFQTLTGSVKFMARKATLNKLGEI